MLGYSFWIQFHILKLTSSVYLLTLVSLIFMDPSLQYLTVQKSAFQTSGEQKTLMVLPTHVSKY